MSKLYTSPQYIYRRAFREAMTCYLTNFLVCKGSYGPEDVKIYSVKQFTEEYSRKYKVSKINEDEGYERNLDESAATSICGKPLYSFRNFVKLGMIFVKDIFQAFRKCIGIINVNLPIFVFY